MIGLFIVCMAFLSGIISGNINNASDLSFTHGNNVFSTFTLPAKLKREIKSITGI